MGIFKRRIEHISVAPGVFLGVPLHFFKIGIHFTKAEQPLRDMGLQEKEAQKDYNIQEICLERTYR